MNDQKTVRAALTRSRDRIVAEPWRLMTIVWQSVAAALIPIAVRQLPAALLAFLEHLQRQTRTKRPRRTALFQAHLRGAFG